VILKKDNNMTLQESDDSAQDDLAVEISEADSEVSGDLVDLVMVLIFNSEAEISMISLVILSEASLADDDILIGQGKVRILNYNSTCLLNNHTKDLIRISHIQELLR
jgi:hypothetical protein